VVPPVVGDTWFYCYPPELVFDPGDAAARYYRYVVEITWRHFLDGTEPSGHAVLVYRDAGELAAAVAAFVTAGLDDGEPTLVVVTNAHWARIEEALAVLGWDEQRVRRSGLLLHADAGATLAGLLEDGRATLAGFERAVTKQIDELDERFPGRRLRVFGEMVDLLARLGAVDESQALEELWNDAAQTRDMLVLCGYQLDVFDRETQLGILPGICRTHSHVRPAADPERMQRAVDAAIDEELGERAGQLYAMVGDQIRQRRVPASQLALMWVSANMPMVADRILASARTHYVRERYSA
jgi:MEDS: MEthanogen/methylotroph, DcmR Sensory domain